MTLSWRPTPRKDVRIFLPENRLRDLVIGPGGIPREEAIARAQARVEHLRAPSLKIIAVGITELSDKVQCGVTRADIAGLQDSLDGIISVSGTFGLAALTQVAMRLVDLLHGLAEREVLPVEPIKVFVEALKLLCPHADPLPHAAVRGLMQGLAGVLQHFEVAIPRDFPGTRESQCADQ